MKTRDESISVQPPTARDLGAQAMKAQVAASLFGDAAAPVRVGPYEITATLGAGGMGVVYAAWDESLGRRVAIKVLPAELVGDARERARLVREAQALAKLSHPNVVHVYEVGEHEGGVFVAMELVEGTSLREWQAEDGRSVTEIVEAYAQAGRGLAAAHRAGLVHRDFKPANALVGLDGRVRVVDFGLAQGPGLVSGASSPTGRELEASLPGPVTRTGALAGTPAYMAPEQLAGRPADARADQFSFCVALYEAVVGCRPFELLVLRSAETDPLPAPARGRRRLSWSLRRAVEHGLAVQPQQRWPDMEALLRAMEARALWRRRLGIWAGPVALGVGAVLLATNQSPTVALCELPERGPAVEWSEERREQVRAAMLGTAQPFAQRAWQEVEKRLGQHVALWGEVYLLACREGDVEQYAQVTECLDRDAASFGEVVAGLSQVDATTVARVHEVLDTLPAPRDCARRAEQTGLPEPAPPERVVRGLARARVALAQGQYGPANELLEALSDSTALDRSMGAEVLTLHGQVLIGLEQMERAQQVLVEAVAEATRDETRARALLTRLRLLLEQERWDAASDHAQQVEAAVGLLESSNELRADYFDLVGRLRLEGGASSEERAEAATLHQVALGLRSERRAMARTTQLLANAYAAQGESDKALELYQEVVLDVFRVEVGPHHPDYADVLFNIGLVAFDAGDYAAAQERLESALKIELATLGPGSTRAARTRVKLAETLLERQQPDAALEHAHAAWAVQSKLPESHSDRRAALVIVASAELDAKQYEPALVHHEQLVEQYGAHDDPFVLHNIAWASCQVRACEGARPRLEQARVQADALLQDRESLDETSVLWLELLRLHTDHTEALVEQAAGHWARARTLLKHTRQQALALELPPEDTSLGTQRDKLLREIDTNLEKLQRAR